MKTLKEIIRFDIDFNNEDSNVEFKKDSGVMLRYAIYKYNLDKIFTLYFLHTIVPLYRFKKIRRFLNANSDLDKLEKREILDLYNYYIEEQIERQQKYENN